MSVSLVLSVFLFLLLSLCSSLYKNLLCLKFLNYALISLQYIQTLFTFVLACFFCCLFIRFCSLIALVIYETLTNTDFDDTLIGIDATAIDHMHSQHTRTPHHTTLCKRSHCNSALSHSKSNSLSLPVVLSSLGRPVVCYNLSFALYSPVSALSRCCWAYVVIVFVILAWLFVFVTF